MPEALDWGLAVVAELFIIGTLSGLLIAGGAALAACHILGRSFT